MRNLKRVAALKLVFLVGSVGSCYCTVSKQGEAPTREVVLATGTKKEFFNELLPIAKDVSARYHIPVSAIVSMAAYESNYGQSHLARRAHNYFGIKAADWKGAVYKHSAKDGTCSYRKYGSLKESVEDYAKFLQKKRYASAKGIVDGKQFVSVVLRSGYCPDGDYLSNISTIMRRHNLRSLDTKI